MIKLDDLIGRVMAAILFREDNDEKMVVSGIVAKRNDEWVLEGRGFTLPLPQNVSQRVRRIEMPSPDCFDGAEFVIGLLVSPFSEGLDESKLGPPVGLKWPEQNEDAGK